MTSHNILFKVLIFILISFFFLISKSLEAQRFKWLGNDPEGDQELLWAPDIRIVEYDASLNYDSLWIKIDCQHQLLNREWSAKIGLDVDANPNNGGIWQSNDHDFRYDYIIEIFHNPNFFPIFTKNILDSQNQFLDTALKVHIVDTATLIIGVRISDLNINHSSVKALVGMGTVFGEISDNSPDTGSYTLNVLHTSAAEQHSESIDISLNPSSDRITITDRQIGNSIKSLKLYDLSGRILSPKLSQEEDQILIDLQNIGTGVFLLEVRTAKDTHRQRFWHQG